MLDPAPRSRRRRLPRFESRASRRVLGACLILAMIAGITVITLRPSPFKDTTTYYAEFDSAQGIGRVDRDIRIAGVNVGEIGEVQREGDDVVLELAIDEGNPLREDAVAALRPHTLFEGSGYVDLRPGSPSAPLLEDGGTIPKSRTRVYVSLDQALRVLHEPTRDALRDLAEVGAKTLRAGAIRGIQRTLRAAPGLFRRLAPTAQALGGPEGDELAGAVRGLSQTAAAIASREADLVPLNERARRTLAALAIDQGAPLDASLAALPGVVEQLEAGGARLEAVIDRFDELAVEVTPAAAELAPLLVELRPLLRSSTPVLVQAAPLVSNLRTVLARFSHAAPELRQLLEAIAPGARILEQSVLPFLNADSRLGLPVYLQLISAFTGATSAQRPYQTAAQNPLGSGHVLRLSAYADPDGWTGLPLTDARPACSDISLGNDTLADGLARLGVCAP